MATHSSVLAWRIPGTGEPGGLRSMGSLRVGHDWASSVSLFTVMHWRRKWQPTPVFLPGESQGWGSLVGCRLWGRRVWHDWSAAAAAHHLRYRFLFCLHKNCPEIVQIYTYVHTHGHPLMSLRVCSRTPTDTKICRLSTSLCKVV